jgi:hypothetical protein
MAKKMLPVRFEEHELAEIRAQAEAEGRSLQDYAHDTLLNAVSARARAREQALEHVVRVSEGLNSRLAQ